MKVLILSHEQVEALLPMADCIGVMSDAFNALADGRAHQPLRMMVRPPDAAGIMVVMPAYQCGSNQMDAEQSAYGLKAICVFPSNSERGLDAHQGAVLLYSGETGELLAVMNASAITAIRTAAVSGLATGLLARSEAGELAIVGSGVQARSHLEAMAAVRPIRRVRVASRTFPHAQQFAAQMSQQYPFPILPTENVEAAVEGADLIVLATNSAEPVLRRDWVAPGTHINAVGAFTPTTREVDSETMAAARLFVDRRESAVNEAGDYLIPLREGAIGPDHIRAELGELVAGQKQGRTSDGEITLFKSLGIPVEDLAAAQYLYAHARALDAGTWVDFQ
ncbi:MAG: ornithine cyclodeaminase family protein [Chloroflexi bacterium]|nr:ornithine cyclodeaminase family protein [Chloroflexota bacterium]